MIPDEAAALLMWIAGHDRRHETVSMEEAQIRRSVWAKMMTDVPLDFARAQVDRHYSKPDAEVIKPVHVQWAWRTSQRVAESRHVDPIPGMPRGAWARRPEWFDQYRRDCDAVRASGGDPAGVQLPFMRVRVDDSRERRCVNHDICSCSHDECRDGWLDVEGAVTDRHGNRSPGVLRCPHCSDAASMRSELHPKRRTRR